MRLPFVKTLLLGAAVLVALTQVASAQVPIRVRGAINKVSGRTLIVTSRDGSTVEVRLAANYTVTGVVKAELQDIKPGVFVGTAAVPQDDGTFRAQEVLIFPETARGTGEGHYPWDLSPGSTMTNATVEAMVERVEGPLVTLTHKGGSVKVAVPPDVPIVTFTTGERAMLRPGAHVFIPAEQQSDGTVTASRILVGKDGLVPPM